MPIKDYYEIYSAKLVQALDSVDKDQLEKAFVLLSSHYRTDRSVYVIGNGGSASLSQHFACDHSKGIGNDTENYPNVISLATNAPLITAIANDLGYDKVFSEQLRAIGQKNLIVAISASGSSPNIVKALQDNQDKLSIAMVGFDGGTIVRDNLAYSILHVQSNNYGIVEDVHQILMHMMSQCYRLSNTMKHELKL
jgi:D-sedoheptulose 7-phosphate isomerase